MKTKNRCQAVRGTKRERSKVWRRNVFLRVSGDIIIIIIIIIIATTIFLLGVELVEQ